MSLQRGLLLARADRCVEATMALDGTEDAQGRLALARCLVQLGRDAEAAAALPREPRDQSVAEDARWLRGVIAADGAEGIWAALEQENAATRALDARLEQRR